MTHMSSDPIPTMLMQGNNNMCMCTLVLGCRVTITCACVHLYEHAG